MNYKSSAYVFVGLVYSVAAKQSEMAIVQRREQPWGEPSATFPEQDEQELFQSTTRASPPLPVEGQGPIVSVTHSSPSLEFVASPSHASSMSPMSSIQSKNVQSRDPPEHEEYSEDHPVPADQFSVELLELLMSHQLRSLSPMSRETVPPQPRPADWVRMLSRIPLQHLWSRKRAPVHPSAISIRSMQRWLHGRVRHRLVGILKKQMCIAERQFRAEAELSSLPLQELSFTHQLTRQHPSLPYIICMMALLKRCISPNLIELLANNNWRLMRLMMIVKDALVY